MPSDFAERAQRAYANMNVPAPPLAAIRARADRRSRQHRTALAVVCSAVLVLAIGLGSGAGAAITSQIRVWLSGGRVSVDVRGLAATTYPTHADLADVMRRATFPVVLPVGLPKGAHLLRVMYSPSDRPSTITLSYVLPVGGTFGVTLIDPKSLEHGVPPADSFSGAAKTWALPGETIAVKANAANADEMAQATQAATSATALAENDAHAVDGIALDAHQLAQTPKLARDGAPLLDNRTVILTEIPRVNGEPNYQHAKYHWPRRIALSPGAVEEVARYLQAHPRVHPPLVYVAGAPEGERVRVLPWRI